MPRLTKLEKQALLAVANEALAGDEEGFVSALGMTPQDGRKLFRALESAAQKLAD